MGGLLATEILFKKPDLFTNYIIISPSLWWDDESLLNVNPERNTKNKHIYLSVGKEGETMERIANVLAEKLVLTYPKTTNIDFEFFEDFEHGNILHISVYNAFERIFKNK